MENQDNAELEQKKLAEVKKKAAEDKANSSAKKKADEDKAN